MECDKLTKLQCNAPCVYVKTKKRGSCKASTQRRKAVHFLQMVCRDSGECLSFGLYLKKIQSFFKFTTFQHVVGKIESIGIPSANGFIRKIKYERNQYTAHAILKSTVSPDADSLVYEYIVGTRFINQVSLRFPCFIHTYGLYFYNSYDQYLDVQYKNLDGKQFLKKALTLQPAIDFKKACVYSQMACILIQNLNNADSVFDVSEDPAFAKYHMVHMLFIVYQALTSLSKVYTHYDLHRQNVLLFRPDAKKTVRYVYHRPGGDISFTCPYVPKLIDYGRSHFNNGKENSKQVYDTICSTQECGRCGEDHGFSMHKTNEFLGISTQRKNESHDLMLIYNLYNHAQYRSDADIMKEFRTSVAYAMFEKMASKLKYNVNIPSSKLGGGTKEDTTLHPKGDIVANVTDAYHELEKIILNPEVMKQNQTTDVVGTFHIYEDRPMEYFKA